MNRPFFAFSVENPNNCRAIITPAGVSLPGDRNKICRTKALWDTGATNSVITPNIVHALGLVPTGKILNRSAAGVNEVNTYIVDIYMPNKVTVQKIVVSECAEQAGMFGIIIGMDIISLGDFSISGPAQKRTVSFSLPSNLLIDFTTLFAQKQNNTAQPLSP